MRGGRIKVAVVWHHVFAGTGPATPPLSGAAWNTSQMPSPPGLDIAPAQRRCEQRIPDDARDQVRVECGTGSGTLLSVSTRITFTLRYPAGATISSHCGQSGEVTLHPPPARLDTRVSWR
jgi:hypothetical protein